MCRLMFCKCLTGTSQKWKILQEMNVVNVNVSTAAFHL